MAATGRVMFSTSEESFDVAVQELRDAFGRTLPIERMGPDVGVIGAQLPGIEDVATACRAAAIAFIRHLTVERVRLPHAADTGAIAAAATDLVAGGAIGTDLAVQVWASGSPKAGYSSGEVFRKLADSLGDRGVAVTRAGQDNVLSCCLTPQDIVLGLNRAANSLADWPGGRVRLAKDPGHVSRAEFKLEELFHVISLDLPTDGVAVDLGAAPGGWTRIVRRRGLAVWAVDPGALDPRVATDSAVHHARTTAAEFFRSNRTLFDLAVNDMRMDPLLSCKIMVQASNHLRRGACAIVTLKTGTHRPANTLRRCLELLAGQYEVLFARQLHHNRHELTVVARRRGPLRRPRGGRGRTSTSR